MSLPLRSYDFLGQTNKDGKDMDQKWSKITPVLEMGTKVTNLKENVDNIYI